MIRAFNFSPATGLAGCTATGLAWSTEIGNYSYENYQQRSSKCSRIWIWMKTSKKFTLFWKINNIIEKLNECFLIYIVTGFSLDSTRDACPTGILTGKIYSKQNTIKKMNWGIKNGREISWKFSQRLTRFSNHFIQAYLPQDHVIMTRGGTTSICPAHSSRQLDNWSLKDSA